MDSSSPSTPAPPPASPTRGEELAEDGDAEGDITAGPWIIGELEVQGLQNVKKRAVLGQVQARKGEVYHRSDSNRDIQSLLGTGQFERVTIDVTPIAGAEIPETVKETLASTNTVRLTFLVAERPVIDDIKIEGNSEVGDSRLSESMTLKEGDPFDEFKARQDVDKILETYREKGFTEASAAYRSEPEAEKPGKIDVIFDVKEGPKTRVEKVEISGAKAIEPKKLVKRMENRPGRIFSRSWQPAKLEEDLLKIEATYKNRGYLDFKVVSSTAVYSEDRSKVTVKLEVEEGPRYRYGKTTFEGNTVLSEAELREALDYREGKIFSLERFQLSLSFIQELYANKGRLKARITPERALNPETGLMDVAMRIEEGPVVKVGHVDVEGNRATKSHVLRRELVIKPGDTFSAAKVRKSQERIYNLGFIDSVEPEILQNPEDPDTVDLTFTVLEGKPGMLTAGAGLSSLDGLVGTLSLSHLNLFGRAQRLSLAWQFGSRVQDYQVSWTTPWIWDKPTSLGVDVFNTQRLRPFSTSFSAFTDKRTGGRLRLGPRFQDDLYHLSLAYTFERVTVTDVGTTFLTDIQPGERDTSSFGIEFARDDRDYIWDPSRGSRHSIGYTLAGGPLQGDIHFHRPTLSNAVHFKTFSVGDYPFVLSFFNRFGVITSFGQTAKVPVFERFFIGGQDTLRGYAVNGEVGPRNGGTVFDVFNIEFKFPLAREHRRTIVAWVFFFDMGGTWDEFRDMKFSVGRGERDWKTDVGFGIRFTTPAFPIRLDWGWGLNHRPGESKFQVNFGLGNLF